MDIRAPRSVIFALQICQHVLSRFLRPLTMGVRALVLDGENRIFLVRHSYVPGWHLPGGGVEVGETVAESLSRELREEGNIELVGPPQLHGVFLNTHATRRDHVVVYVVRSYVQGAPRAADWEILEAGFFPVDALPEGTVRATRARIAEVLDGAAISDRW